MEYSERDSDDLQPRIVFLMCVPRSGSTLLQHILAAHSDIASTGESWLLLPPLAAIKPECWSAGYDSRSAQVGLREFTAQLPGGREQYLAAVRHAACALYGAILRKTGRRYFVDKTPRYYSIVPELLDAFPRARFLFLVRNPLAVMASVIESMAAWNYATLADAGIRKDLLEGYSLLRRGAESLGDRAALVRYEELVSTPEETVRRLCAWLSVEFEPEMLHYGRFDRVHGTLGDSKSVHRHASVVSIYADTWKEKLRGRRERLFARALIGHLGEDLLEWLGYPLSSLERVVGTKITAPARLSLWSIVTTPPHARSPAQRLAFFGLRVLRRHAWSAARKGRTSPSF